MLSFVGNLDTTSGLYESRHGEKEREEGGERGEIHDYSRGKMNEKNYTKQKLTDKTVYTT